ncbi:hypothetical protein HK097_003095, partial [Rhizophlyctis rosea]
MSETEAPPLQQPMPTLASDEPTAAIVSLLGLRRESDAALKAAAVEVLQSRFTFTPPPPSPKPLPVSDQLFTSTSVHSPSPLRAETQPPPAVVVQSIIQQSALDPTEAVVDYSPLPSTPPSDLPPPPPSLSTSTIPSSLPSSSSELTAFALTTLFAPRTSIAEAMANLSPTQLQLLERSVERVKQLRGQDAEKLAQKVATSSNPAAPAKSAYPPYVPPAPLPQSPGTQPLPPMTKAAADAFAAAFMQQADPRAVMGMPYAATPNGIPVSSIQHIYAPLMATSYPPNAAHTFAHAILQAQTQPQQPGMPGAMIQTPGAPPRPNQKDLPLTTTPKP